MRTFAIALASFIAPVHPAFGPADLHEAPRLDDVKPDGPGFAVQELAPGVFALVRTKPPGMLLDANVLFVVGDDDVLVVDSNLTPTSAEASIAALRRITSKPVRTLVNTHRHADHVTGNAVYQREFPGVEIVGHAAMREDLAAHGEETLRGWIGWAQELSATLARALDSGIALSGAPLTDELAQSYSSDLEAAREIVADAPRMSVVLPTKTITERLSIVLGQRTIEVLPLGKGHTRGDLVVWLPLERIVATGDLVTAPVPLIGADQSYVEEWSATLGRVLSLDPAIIVPGHGPVLRDHAHVDLYRGFLATVTRDTQAAMARGATLEAALASTDLDSFRERMAGKSSVLRTLFANWGSTSAVSAMYRVRDEAKSSAAPSVATGDGNARFKLHVSDLKIGDGALDRGWIGGVSLADVDDDGDLDLYATRGFDVTVTDPSKFHPDRSMLYRNDGRGTFARVEESALSTAENYASGGTFGDVDQDGDLDCFVSTEVGQKDAFYRNRGGGKFVREELDAVTSTPSSNFTSTWVDIEGDGDLDLYVGGPTLEQAARCLVYRNDEGKFERVSGTPIENGKNNPGAVLWADLDNDGDQDLLVANSDISRASKLAPAEIEHPVVYRNEGDWQFSRIEGQAFDKIECTSNVAALGDVDNDGDLDLYLGLFSLEGRRVHDRLFQNDGHGRFEALQEFAEAPHAELASGAAFADVDADGDLDLLMANFGDSLRLWENDGSGRFAPVNEAMLLARKTSHAGVAAGDLDDDGDVDFVIGNWGETSTGEFATLVRNESPQQGHWVELVLVEKCGTRNPPGARVTLVTRKADGSERRQLRESMAQTGFRSQGASPFLLALPPGEPVVRFVIRWPDGTRESRESLPENQRCEIRRKR